MRRIDPMERALNLLTLLRESTRPLSAAEIADEMAYGDTPYPDDEAAQRQQLTKDRQAISAALGIAIRRADRQGSDAGQTEYWIDEQDILLPDLGLDDDERLMLSLSLAAVARRVPSAGEAGLKLGAGDLDAPFDFSVDVPDVVFEMIGAARSRAVVEICTGEETCRFEPWAVVLRGGAWFAVGYDADLTQQRTVRLGRAPVEVRELGMARSGVTPELDERVVSELADEIDEADQELPVANVLVDEVAVARASLWPNVVERSQVDFFEQVTVRAIVDDSDELRSWLLSLRDRAELLSPPELRSQVIAWLREMVDRQPSGAELPSKPTAGRRRGPPPVTERLHRVLSIVPWLHRQGLARIDDIAERVGVAPEKIMKDLQLASMSGRPPHTPDMLYGMVVDPDEGMVYCTETSLKTGELQLTGRQAAAVSVALSALEALPGGDQEVLARLRKKLDLALGDLPVRVELDEPPFLAEVRAAVDRCERIRIEYVDLDDNLNEREVDPLMVFVDRGSSYVVGDDHLRGDERVFRVDRILSVVPTGERFEPRRVESPAGRTWSWMVADREVVVRLPPGSDWVLDRHATTAHVIGDDGWLTVWLSVVSERWLAALLLSCGPGAEVVRPDDLIDLPGSEARRILANYQ